jgi:hypothetical protein
MKHPRISVASIIMALVSLGPGLSGQTPEPGDPSDHILTILSRQPLLPPDAEATANRIVTLAMMGGVPLGFEDAASGIEPASLPQIQAGGSVRDALNSVVIADPRYTWRVVNGVIVVRPANAWADKKDALSVPAGEVDWHDVTPVQALTYVGDLILRHSVIPVPDADPKAKHFSIDLASGSILDVLNEVVRVHGGLAWTAIRAKGEQSSAPPSITLTWLDGQNQSTWRPPAGSEYFSGAPLRRFHSSRVTSQTSAGRRPET